jgi:uncharacterized damage-inducible protein DinB
MDPLRELFRHHAWATLTLIDFCLGLPLQLLHEVVPSTDRAILNTLGHLVGSDQRYLEALTGQPPKSPILPGEAPALADLRLRFEAQTRGWETLLDRVAELDVTLPARGSWPDMPHAQNVILLQAIQHSNDHRTQICTALSLLGQVSPDIDGWSYWDATRQA